MRSRLCTHQHHCARYIFATCVVVPHAAFPNHAQNAAISTDSEYSHHARSQQPHDAGGLGPNLRILLLADRNMNVAREYGCLIEDQGITLHGSYLIDPKGVLRQITVNDLPIGCSVDEALHLVQAFQFTMSDLSYFICGAWC